MIEKHSWYPAFDPILGQQVHIISAPGMSKTASITKEAALTNECLNYIDKIEPENGKIYTVMNAITAGEFYGSNRNGDYFNEDGLMHKGADYGYQTFLNGHNFVHHNNRDPIHAVGIPKAAFYNERMHRIELVTETDMARLKEKDAEMAEKLASGEPVDVSMGSKCDFDVCSICRNKAATKLAYCEHLSEHMNEVMDDGRKVYAYTPHPKFFDISFVKRGADRTAKVMHRFSAPEEDMAKAASTEKESDMIKYSPPSGKKTKKAEEVEAEVSYPVRHKEAVDLLERYEPDLPNDVIDQIAKHGSDVVIATLTKLGFVLKPREYQRLVLVADGQEKLANQLDESGIVFETNGWIDNPKVAIDHALIDEDVFNAEVARGVSDFVEHRSIFEPWFSERLKTAQMLPKSRLQKASSIEKKALPIDPSVLAALGLGYLVYRKTAPEAELKALSKAFEDPRAVRGMLWKIIPLVGGYAALKRMADYEPPVKNVKVAGVPMSLVLPIAGSYLYSAHARKKMREGRRVSALEHMFASHPLPLAIGGVFAATKLKGKFMPKGTIKASSDINKSAIDIGEIGSGIAAGFYKARPWAVPAAAFDAYVFNKIVGALTKKPAAAAKKIPVAAARKAEKVVPKRVGSLGKEGELVRGGQNAYYARAF